ncbi:MAG: aldehyde ferredoxin oxidoreductase family protein, partial [Thermoproteus sp.]
GGHRADPLSPENPLIIASGPLGGTRVPMATRAYAVFRSPLTGIFGGSNLGGTLGAVMRYAGVDVLAVTGRAERPAYLLIEEGKAKLHDASSLWGIDAIEAEMELKKEHGRNAAVLAIGPAGENLVKFASINHEYWRQFGRTGGGAVMGSKRLKAIVFVSDRKEVLVAKPDALERWIREFTPSFLEKTKALREGGTLRLIDMGNSMGFFPAYYWTRLSLDGWEAISWSKKIKPEYFLKPEACLYCPAACHRPVRSRKFGIDVDLEYETVYAVGGLAGVKDVDWLVKINDVADRLGMDSISLGNVLAFAVAASKAGKLPIRLEWGDGEALARLAEDIAYRRGVGDLLAEGVKRAAEALGLSDLAVHVKGLEPAGYDPRALKGMALNYAIGYRGADHLATMAYALDIAGKFGGADSLGPEKVEAIAHMEEVSAVMDSLVLCKFGRDAYDVYPGGAFYEIVARLLGWITGEEWRPEEVKEAGERVVLLDRLLNVEMGVDSRQDDLPPPLKRPLPFEGRERKIDEAELKAALRRYYEIRGWDANGVPKRETVEKLLPEVLTGRAEARRA